jgi:hypothetical protein
MIIIHAGIREIKEKLEVEEAGKKIADMQGQLTGFKKFIEYLSSNLRYSYNTLEMYTDTGDSIPELEKMSYTELESLIANYEGFKKEDWYKNFIEAINSTCENIKESFLHLDKPRDVWYEQGFYKAIVLYKKLINQIYSERDRRDNEKKRLEKDEPLFHQGVIEEETTVLEFPEEEKEDELSFDNSVCVDCDRNDDEGCGLGCRRNTDNSEDPDLFEPKESEEMQELSETMEYSDPNDEIELDLDEEDED